METVYQKIIRKTGKKPISCKCKLCASQCSHPCLGTPEDMAKIINAGYKDRVMKIKWTGAKDMGVYDEDILMITPRYDEAKKSCTFLNNGLCELHDLGLKPTEGKLSHHSTTRVNPKKSIGWWVAKEWINLKQDLDKNNPEKT